MSENSLQITTPHNCLSQREISSSKLDSHTINTDTTMQYFH